MNMSESIVPYTTSKGVIDLIKTIFPNNEITIQNLIEYSRKNKSSINNIIPTAKMLGFVDSNREVIILNETGFKLGRSIASNDVETTKKLFKDGIEKSEVLKFVITLLEEKKSLSTEDIGRRISFQFHKNWSSSVSYRSYGRFCADIISFAGFGYYKRGLLTNEEGKNIKMNGIKIPLPDVSANKIMTILTNNFGKKKTVDDFSGSMGTVNSRMVSELNVCVALGFLLKEHDGYSLTSSGKQLADPHQIITKKRKIFNNALLNSPYKNLVLKIIDMDKEMLNLDIGEILAKELDKDWSVSTKTSFAKKFQSWLTYSGILIQLKRGTYKVNQNLTNLVEIQESPKEVEKIESIPSNPEYQNENNSTFQNPNKETIAFYSLGRLIEKISFKLDENKDFENDFVELLALCRNFPGLKNAVELLQSHYEIYREIEDKRILMPDINLIDSQIRGN